VLVDSTHPAQFGRFADAGIDKLLVPPANRQFVISNHYRIPDGLPEALKATAQALALMPDSVYSLYSEMQHLQFNAQLTQRLGGRLPDVPLVVLAHDSRIRATDSRRLRLAETWLGLQDELAREVSRGRLVITNRSGHYIQLDQPELVIDAIHDVVRQVRAAQP
jgi:pimeloyl-ACP methyl ester carboxylesterase